MPIRMEDDPQQGNNNNNNDGGRGGVGGLGKLLPFLLLFLFKKPKYIIPVLIIGAIWYFFFGGAQMLNGGGQNNVNDPFSLGAQFNEEKYLETEIFEPLAYGSSGIPSSYSLLKYAPPRKNQGRQGSCVGWASAYAARSILYARETGKNPSQIPFSPSYLYNHIAIPNSQCQGSYLPDAMDFMKRVGAMPLSQFPYDPSSCQTRSSRNQQQVASNFRVRGYQRLTKGGNRPDMQAIKQYIAKGGPVVIGMEVGGTFMRAMEGRRLWEPNRSDRSKYGYGGHAMCVIGYDDNLAGGAFEIMNSWGPEWGQNGVAWVKYRDFDYYVMEAYGLYPMGQTIQQNKDRLAVKFGLFLNNQGRSIQLRNTGGNTFQTMQAVKKKESFKIQVANSVECYTYVFGMETDGSSYVLFPYTPQHSAYCGITGVRLFPRDKSLVPDEIGNKDYMAVVVSKRELDYKALNNSINNSRGSSYAEKVNNAIRSRAIPGVKFQGGNAVSFDGKIQGNKDVVAVIMAIDKQ
ncbi:MAG: C1 family peptidase [Bacteroidia bacterium]|nr:C1 family peptidase [Bacteroidia bacterium]